MDKLVVYLFVGMIVTAIGWSYVDAHCPQVKVDTYNIPVAVLFWPVPTLSAMIDHFMHIETPGPCEN